MNIRKMELSDYDKVDILMQELHKLHVKERPDLYVELEHPYSREKFETLVTDEQVISILSEQDHIVTGICFAEIRTRSMMVNMTTAYINDIIVKDSYRRQGIAKSLFLAAEERAKKKGAKRIDLMVWSFNKDAIAFYEKIGMSPQRIIYEKKLL